MIALLVAADDVQSKGPILDAEMANTSVSILVIFIMFLVYRSCAQLKLARDLNASLKAKHAVMVDLDVSRRFDVSLLKRSHSKHLVACERVEPPASVRSVRLLANVRSVEFENGPCTDEEKERLSVRVHIELSTATAKVRCLWAVPRETLQGLGGESADPALSKNSKRRSGVGLRRSILMKAAGVNGIEVRMCSAYVKALAANAVADHISGAQGS